jgi:hypothetical protein
MFTGNWESSNLICVVGEALPHTVLQNEGWQWVNEGTAIKPKWGFVTWQVGAKLVLKVDTRASAARHSDGADQQQQAGRGPKQGQASDKSGAAEGTSSGKSKSEGQPAAPAAAGGADSTRQHAVAAPALSTPPGSAPPAPASAAAKTTAAAAATKEAAAEEEEEDEEEQEGSDLDAFAELAVPDMIVWVGYVRSWRQMGTASFNCIKGCKCQGTTVDALHDLGNTQQHMVKLYTTEAAECLIEVKVRGHVGVGLGVGGEGQEVHQRLT